MMNKPKMILFDYGQTLVAEKEFNGVRGTEAVLKYAVKNKYHLSVEELQARATDINRELGRFNSPDTMVAEVHNHFYQNYFYKANGIELSLSNSEIETLFWDQAAEGKPTEGIQEFLNYLQKHHIRTGVISNIAYSQEALEKRISRLIHHPFEFILATSEYVFRKPNPRIFTLALEIAELSPKEVWYCGDHPYYDVIGAKNASLQPVLYQGATKNSYENDEGAIIIQHWQELQELLESLNE